MFWVVASLYKLIITSDIPVSYSTSEAVIVQVLFSLSTLMFLLTANTFSSNKPRIIMAIIFCLLFIIKWHIIDNYYKGAEYFHSSFAQLETSILLSLGILILFNFYLVLQNKRT